MNSIATAMAKAGSHTWSFDIYFLCNVNEYVTICDIKLTKDAHEAV